jgi:hypothetical protein
VIRIIAVGGQPWQKVSETPSQPRSGEAAHTCTLSYVGSTNMRIVVQAKSETIPKIKMKGLRVHLKVDLPHKCKALSSKTSIRKKTRLPRGY